MPDQPKTNWALLAALISPVLTLIAAAVMIGEVKGQVRQNAKDIAAMQIDSRSNMTTLSQINERTARMETKLSILLPDNLVRERHQ